MSAKKPKKGRVSARVRAAITFMVDEGLPRAEAAAKAGVSDHGLYKALREPSALTFKNERMEVLRTAAAARSILRVDRLADGAESEHVRFKANELLLDLDGQTSVGRQERRFPTPHQGHTPGLVIVLGSQSVPKGDGDAVDITPPRQQINRTGAFVPHPLATPRVNMIGRSRPHPLDPRAKEESNG